ncbi:radical SAM protein [uncultured Parabacteroides sp.]|uniref:radical SAM protein n=1 Tax=uncultured Parabacteroides sp. TaxID=512312 RepID=UPI00261DE886|nr:radical SAM protein [uncultured Parabacteroides sp.]
MSKKRFNGKAIYNPSGKAGEYSYWACNFYTGCSNDCDYCYCKKGIISHVWSNAPKLKKCFKDERHAIEVFEKELMQNLPDLQEYGLFFTFTSDPMLPETIELTRKAISICIDNFVPVKILTKRADFLNKLDGKWSAIHWSLSTVMKTYIAFGFTLTGHDELEKFASTNAERIETMKKLHEAGFKTWASIEPIVDLKASLSCIEQTLGFCDLYKIGLMSGGKLPDKEELRMFVGRVCYLTSAHGAKVYWKDCIKKHLGRDIISAATVDRNYNIFNG